MAMKRTKLTFPLNKLTNMKYDHFNNLPPLGAGEVILPGAPGAGELTRPGAGDITLPPGAGELTRPGAGEWTLLGFGEWTLPTGSGRWPWPGSSPDDLRDPLPDPWPDPWPESPLVTTWLSLRLMVSSTPMYVFTESDSRDSRRSLVCWTVSLEKQHIGQVRLRFFQ